ncbi:transcriptional regulator with XRE-family HTH domain [Paenibacillus forsythiae]|uniref:Transcriptional regulator with XRE-family HTH domain n=1 Tax=Paenibacillus forsythiae TaxID=365616 RepID=A0ABU3H5M9_9BACL|nr:helix-turn-helix transcriptional regulator [Paenibacillus forsythiae]MDT3426119.1 transcriptional regulator with XRE-family HTH domain [Paenibacillus forsythiae]
MIRLDRLRERRIENKLTHEELAEKLGISRQGYGNYESGKRDIDTDTLARICQILDTDSDYLLGLTDKPKWEPSLSFYGGPEGLTEDELEEAEAAVRRYREMKERAAREAEKNK